MSKPIKVDVVVVVVVTIFFFGCAAHVETDLITLDQLGDNYHDCLLFKYLE